MTAVSAGPSRVIGMIQGIDGPLAPAAVGAVLAAETLVRPAATPTGNIGQAASVSAFERAPVTMGILGRLLLGATNRDDRSLSEADAEAALRAIPAGDALPLVVVLADPVTGVAADPAVLRRLARTTGVALVWGVSAGGSPGDPAVPDPASPDQALPDPAPGHTAAMLPEVPDAAGIVGAIAPGDVDGVAAAARAAAQAGLPLALGPASSLEELAAALASARAAGLSGARILVTGPTPLIAAPGVGVDPARLDALIDLLVASGAWLCVDDLGRIPTVRTVVSDHDVAGAILRCVARGLGDRIVLSVGIRNKHRLTAFGGNGLEFLAEQYLPYLGMLGITEPVRRGLAGANAARLLSRIEGGAA
ncbi:hypothetical protein [Leucobacter chromiireducens]|uniref:Phosphotriesterase-related protein n=1 Tax=Leucobacter chromiireducens subsp. solipictus TaxID=398235 RepID=A0ABS1SKK7_9MICO|nr:hypothetical protein [Leucobacter chromiireducens]MBL3680024.1 hypothetical protein [Leucobacter chromiireducens subsp. solipictus]